MDDDEGMGLAMTADNADGIDEDLTRAVGMVMIAASRAGEQLTRMKQAAYRERQARATGNAQRDERELVAHTEAARAYFEVVTRPEYLTAAADEQIRDVTRQAEGWRERLPEGQCAADAATAEIGARGPATDSRPQRGAILAGQAEAADQRAAGSQQPAAGAQPEPPEGWDRVGKYYGTGRTQQDDQQQGQQAAATAAYAQARPAREASAAGRQSRRQGVGRGDRPSARGIQQPGIGI